MKVHGRMKREHCPRGHWSGAGHHRPWHARGERFRAQYPQRVRMFRRFAIAVAVLLLLGLSGVSAIAWFAAGKLGPQGAWTPAAAVLVILLAGAVAARVIRAWRGFTAPLGAVMDAAASVADGDYTARVQEHGSAPMRSLARSFNTMTQRLEAADRVRRDLMADLAHELRTPLSVLQGRIEGMIDGVYALEPAELDLLRNQTGVLARLIEDLRTIALSDAGALPLQKESVDVGELVRDIAREFEPQSRQGGVSMRVDVPAAPSLAEVDAVRIREVLANLVGNALRHTPRGGAVTLSVAAATGTLTVGVKDTGEGIAPDELARVFDRFHKARDSKGAGLGLAIVKSLVEAHGGEISARSAPGEGTTMQFTLPPGAG